jgi:hypothetical protein
VIGNSSNHTLQRVVDVKRDGPKMSFIFEALQHQYACMLILNHTSVSSPPMYMNVGATSSHQLILQQPQSLVLNHQTVVDLEVGWRPLVKHLCSQCLTSVEDTLCSCSEPLILAMWSSPLVEPARRLRRTLSSCKRLSLSPSKQSGKLSLSLSSSNDER